MVIVLYDFDKTFFQTTLRGKKTLQITGIEQDSSVNYTNTVA
jgi:hypothetical protein